MSVEDSVPRIGQIVRITHGREAEKYAIVIRVIDEKYVMLADGDKRKFDRPKKKNSSHIEMMNYISQEVRDSLLKTGRVTNGKLRFALDKFVGEVVTD